MSTQSISAPAKINLCFEVLGRRSDGYHEVRTVYQAIDLADQLELESASDLSLEVTPHGAAPIDDNLVLRAAQLLRDETHTQQGVRIRLTKRIPAAAGLGGGSSDAAATLVGLRALWGLDVSDQRLLELAVQLGADVPFFIHGGTAMGAGRGEVLTPLPTRDDLWAVVLYPGEVGDNKTARLYGLLTPEHYSPHGQATELLAERIREGRAPLDGLFNIFESVVSSAYPGYATFKIALESAGVRDVHMAGAGPSLFAVVATAGEAAVLQEKLAALKLTAFASRFLPAWG